LTPEAEAFLRKARESLDSAEADLAAGRFNSAANRAYYAAFQAAISALLEHGIRRPGRSWEHRFVMSEFSGKLVSRRKIVSAKLGGKLELLMTTRLVGDYSPESVSRRVADRSLREAQTFLGEIGGQEEE
jgi:uncharacterized protein (UPF0332 family)